jgi:hypothetical protein
VEVQLGRADDVDAVWRLAQVDDTAGGGFGRDEVMRAELGVAVAEHLVDGARDLAALDMGAADVVRRGDQGAGQRLDPVAVHHDQVGRCSGHSRKSRSRCLAR